MTVAFFPQGSPDRSAARELYGLLDAYYANNGLYDLLRRATYQQALGQENLVALRNPAHRIVETYSAHLWPGALPDALPIETENDRIIDPIHQVWTWSNWNARKQVAARWLALYGDLFIKVIETEDQRRVFFQLIRPHYVSDLRTDERGVVEYIRMDVPQVEQQGDYMVQITHTEVWTGESYRLWRHDRKAEHDVVRLEELGAPEAELPLSAFGIDFIPIVHIPFQDVGDARGVGAITHALDKIDEANRMVTRLHQMLFRHNNVTHAVESNVVDADGRPLAPPRIGKGTPDKPDDTSSVTVGDTTFVRLPSGWHLNQLVPNLHYADALAILNAHLLELESDLPEMAFYRIRSLGANISGRAVRLLLSDAVARILETRGNAEAGLVRANQMALTIGANRGLFGDIGTYDAGDFDHQFQERAVVALSDLEEAEGVAALDGIVSNEEQMRRLGMSEEDIQKNMQEKKAAMPPVPEPTLPPQPSPSTIGRGDRVASA